MKVEIRVNGSYHLELTPETLIERTVLTEMLRRAASGAMASVHPLDDAPTVERCRVDVSVEC